MPQDQDGLPQTSFAAMMADDRKRGGFRQYLLRNEAECEWFIQDLISGAAAQLSTDPPRRHLAENAMGWAEWTANQARHWADIAKCWGREFRNYRKIGNCVLRGHQIAVESPTVPTVESLTRELVASGDLVRHIEYRMVPAWVFSYVMYAATDYGSISLSMMKAAEGLADGYGSPTPPPARKKSKKRAAPRPEEAFVGHYGKAESQMSWLYIAKSWFEDLDSVDDAVRCLEKAEGLAVEMSTTAGWVEVAKVWARVMGENGQARRCVGEAETLLDRNAAEDYLSLTEGTALLGDRELAAKYLDDAESLTNAPSGWSAIASNWRKLGYSEREARALENGDRASCKLPEESPQVYRDDQGRYVRGRAQQQDS